MHFPPAGLPQLQDLRLFAQTLTSNLDYPGSAATSLAASLTSVCIATRQSATAVVLCQHFRHLHKDLQRRHVTLQCGYPHSQAHGSSHNSRDSGSPEPSEPLHAAATEDWTVLVSAPDLEAWAYAQQLSIRRISATYAAAVQAGAVAST